MTPGARRLPVCRPAVLFAFALGAAGLQRCPVLPDASLGIFLLLAALSVVAYRPRLALPASALAGFAYAALFAAHALSQRLTLDESGRTGTAVLEITGLPRHADGQWQFEARVLQSDAFPGLQSRKLKLSWYRTGRRLHSGDVWRMQLLLRTPNGVQNPGGVDAEQRALQQGFSAQGYVKKQAHYLHHRDSLDRFRERLSSRIAARLGADAARFVQALALGDVRALTDDDWDVLRRTGITHLIAISGFHVGIVALFAAFAAAALYRLIPPLGVCLPRPQALALASIAAAWAYTALAGFAVPTVRTAWMITAFMLCRLLLRRCTVAQAVALSLSAIVLRDPFSVLAPGFWLSFGGVLFLVGFMPQTAGKRLLGPFLRAQWVVTLGLLPLSIACFGQTTVIGPVVNMLAIPWISLVVVPLALLGCLFAGLPGLSGLVWKLSALSMQWLWQGLLWLQDAPWSSLLLPEPSLAAVLLALFGAGCCLLPRAVPGKWLGVLLLLPLLWPRQEAIPAGGMQVAMIDVGQGLSVLVRTRGHALLYDAGAGQAHGFSRGETAVLPALRALAVAKLDRIVISHGDNDHAGGLPAVLRGIGTDTLMASEGALPGRYRRCRAGQRWQWDGVRFEVLWPEMEPMESDNDRSCVLRIEAADGRSLLLTGDIGKEAEAALVARYGDGLAAEVLTVPHHGSRTSSTDAFIAAVRPRLALVSSGFQNRFRHPNAQVLARYRRHGSALAGTVEYGWSELRSSPSGWYWRHRERVDERRYWMRPAPEAAVTGY